MVEHCSDGSTIWASIARLAAYSKFSERTVQRLIRGLHAHGILTEIAPANAAKRRPATYRINEAAMHDDPVMAPYLNRQGQLPGVRRAPVPGEPIPDPLVSSSHQSGVQQSGVPVSASHQSGVQQSPDPKAFDPKDTNPKPEIHHGDAALNSMPAWLAFKEQLRSELSEDEWNLWVRPMLLLKAMPASADQKHLLAAIPPSARIQSAATKRLPMMRELLATAGLNISLTHYPNEWEIEESRRRYGVDIAPKPWTRKDSA
jgi:helix-turn-helix protein